MKIRLLTRCGCERLIDMDPCAPRVCVPVFPDRDATGSRPVALSPFEPTSRSFRRTPHMDRGGPPTFFEEMS